VDEDECEQEDADEEELEDEEEEDDEEEEEGEQEEEEDEEDEEAGKAKNGVADKLIANHYAEATTTERLGVLRPKLVDSLHKGDEVTGARTLLSFGQQNNNKGPNFHTDKPRPTQNQLLHSLGPNLTRHTEFALVPNDEKLPRLIVQVAYGSANPHQGGRTTNITMVMNANLCVYPLCRHPSYTIFHGTGQNAGASATPVVVVGLEHKRTCDDWPASKTEPLVLRTI